MASLADFEWLELLDQLDFCCQNLVSFALSKSLVSDQSSKFAKLVPFESHFAHYSAH